MQHWVKRLGQHHLSQDNASVTLCGKPMLGNNYAGHIPQNELKPCKECHDKVRELEGQK